MKRALTICGLFCALMIVVASVSAQKGANFAGTWELDKAKSTIAAGMMADEHQKRNVDGHAGRQAN